MCCLLLDYSSLCFACNDETHIQRNTIMTGFESTSLFKIFIIIVCRTALRHTEKVLVTSFRRGNVTEFPHVTDGYQVVRGAYQIPHAEFCSGMQVCLIKWPVSGPVQGRSQKATRVRNVGL